MPESRTSRSIQRRHAAIGATAPPAALLLAALGAAVACAQPSPPAAPDATAAMAHAHAHDTATPSPAVGRPGGPEKVAAEAVTYGEVGGKPAAGYLARPEGASKGGPGVLLVHEWWGLNDNLRDLARQFASHGYTALAVDLYGGKSAQEPDAAQGLMREVMAHPEPAEENLRQAYRYLHETAGAGKVGVVGWCFGGGWSLQTGLLLPDEIDAVVMYYGRPELDRGKLGKLKAPLLGLFGEKDEAFPVETVREFEALLRELGKDAEVHVFPGAGHGFANPSGKSYVPAAADEAWKLTLGFFAKHLKG
jgi:carboxymethylenebutenolidase